MKDPAVPAQRLHGHRAGLLLDYIRTATSDGGMIGRIYTRRMNAKSSAIPLPLDLLKIEDTSLGAHWAGFCQWMFSRIPAQIIAWASDRTLTFADGGQPILAPLPSLVDLSALPYRFRSTRTLLPGAKYTINVAGTGAASAVAYKLTGASAAGDYIGTAEPRLEFPVTQIGSGESFLALLVKQRAEPPYTAATPTELTVTYVDAGAPPGLERFTYFKAAISAAMRCTQAMAPVTCPIVRGGMALYNYIEGIFPLSWQGLNFSGNWTASRATYTVSGSVTADLSQLTQLRIRETYTTAQPAGTIDFTFVLAGIPALMDYSGVVDLPALARLEYTIPWIRYIANPGLYVKELTGTFTPSNGGTPTMYVADLPNTRPTEPPISVEFSYSRP